jgi:hypothetical protein
MIAGIRTGEVSARGCLAGLRERIDERIGAARRTQEAGRKSTARSVTAENYSGVGSLGETEAIDGPPKREADRAQTIAQGA